MVDSEFKIHRKKSRESSVSSNEIWNIPESCKQPSIEMQRLNNNYFILSKRHNEFDGIATVCSMKIITVHAFRTLFFQDFYTKHEAVVNDSRHV